MKFVAKEERFSQSFRPYIGTIVTYSPCKYLTKTIIKKVNNPFLKEIEDNSCKVIDNTKHLVIVKFKNRRTTDMVSPDFLTIQTLTQAGRKAMSVLKDYLKRKETNDELDE